MILIDRTIESTTTKIPEMYHCQASFNSDGMITLRHFDPNNPKKDTIVILSDAETSAILRLLQKMKTKLPPELPF